MNQVLLVNQELGTHADLCLLFQEGDYENVVLDEVETGNDALRKVVNDSYDLLILNLDLPNTNILGLINKIRLLNPVLPILIFSSEIEYIVIKRYLTSGVNGYCFFRNNNINEIVKAVGVISKGKWYISQEMSDLMVEQVLYNKKADRFDSLDEKEFEIFTHLIKGETVANIAKIMGVHIPTISVYKTRILDKLRITNLLELKNMVNTSLLIEN
ncbi:response regulator transcription factor [Dyadobacter sp. CY356]|uniref:response regulator transcription factor n=1 Tax=Dyadobacter sp. CY356 TaxID=2906442 RepID=UPI001F329303|nr:response regulator transcription factor [Dyadobacter sp. CY356]MCF0058023.1 response regulator transcription factor [Dyadobacter sp. CY356]